MKTSPALRVLIPMVLGIVLGYRYPILEQASLLAFAGVTVGLAMAMILARNWTKQAWLGLTSLNGVWLCMGWLSISMAHELRDPNHGSHRISQIEKRSNHKASSEQWLAEIVDVQKPRKGKHHFGMTLRLIQTVDLDTNVKLGGRAKILVMYDKDSTEVLAREARQWQAGDSIAVPAKIFIKSRNGMPHLPGATNWDAQLHAQNMYLQGFARPKQLERWSQDTTRRAEGGINQLKSKINALLHKYARNEWGRATLQAMLVAETDELSDELRNAYTYTGTIHMLSVSGLHVGIILVLLGKLFWWLSGAVAWQRWLRAGLIIAGVWGFAVLAGMSAPIARAALMFSLWQVGSSLGYRQPGRQALWVSALILLCIDPFQWFQLSFQLSYLAFVGLLYIAPAIESRWEPKRWIWKQVWSLTCVSLGAQLAVLPLMLYYFHSFPLYFLIANIVAIPLSGPILMAAALALVLGLAYDNLLSQWILDICSTLLGYIGKVLEWISQWPGGAQNYIPMEEPGFYLSLAALVCLVIGIKGRGREGIRKRKGYWYNWQLAAWVLCLGALTVTIKQHTDRWLTDESYAWNVGKHKDILIRNGRTAVWVHRKPVIGPKKNLPSTKAEEPVAMPRAMEEYVRFNGVIHFSTIDSADAWTSKRMSYRQGVVQSKDTVETGN